MLMALLERIRHLYAIAFRRPKEQFTSDGIRKTSFYAGWLLTKKLKRQWKQFVGRIKPFPDRFKGKGIVICAGGIEYFTCAWVNIKLLRAHGCELPVEIWYTGNELTPESIRLLGEMNVRCRNSYDFTQAMYTGYALKPFALLNSDFKEILFLDADNNCVKDPAYLFDSPEYRQYGAVFWPDCWKTDKRNPIWKITGTKYDDGFEQESGQLLINKEKCWKELNLAMYFNVKSKYYYRMLLGDKDTFRFAWKALGSPYHMINTPVGFCGYMNPGQKFFFGLSLVQHDTAGNIIFLHRNLLKWDITKGGEKVWHVIKRFRKDAKKKVFLHRYMGKNGNGNRVSFIDITGDVQSDSFEEQIGDIETTCLRILKELRAAAFYREFLFCMYFERFRPERLNSRTA